MTAADIAAANDEMFITSQNLRGSAGSAEGFAARRKNAEQALKAVRESIRKNEERRLSLGDELAVFAEQIHTGKRKVTIQTVLNDHQGQRACHYRRPRRQERERRTATKEELAKAQDKTASILTQQQPGDKGNPQDELVTVTVLARRVQQSAKEAGHRHVRSAAGKCGRRRRSVSRGLAARAEQTERSGRAALGRHAPADDQPARCGDAGSEDRTDGRACAAVR